MNLWQWGILLAGIVAVIVMVLFARRGDASNPWPDNTDVQAPSLDDSNVDLESHDAHRNGPSFDDDAVTEAGFAQQAEAKIVPPKVEPRPVLLFLVSKDRQPRDGRRIHAALNEAQLRHGMQDFYHRTFEVDGAPEPAFSVANMVKPGILDPMRADELRTLGLVMFMQVPNPMGSIRALTEMFDVADQLATLLDADVLDEQRAPLNDHRRQALLNEVARLDPPAPAPARKRRT